LVARGGGGVQAPDHRDVRGTVASPLRLRPALGRRHHRPAPLARGAGAVAFRQPQRAGRGYALRRVPDVTMRRRSPLDRLLKAAFGASVALGIGVPALSFANGTLKPHEGCAVTLVVDGDTVRLLCPAEGFVTARLTGFDTPEVFSPGC